MRNLFLAATLAFTAGIYAQDIVPEKQGHDPKFTCKDGIVMDYYTKIIVFNEDASFKNDVIAIENADKIVYNTVTKEIIVTGKFNYTFDGAVQVTTPIEKHELRYTIGDAVVYMD
jgi:lipopolysaccharide assembly outer membrane protein LptD (OstA)